MTHKGQARAALYLRVSTTRQVENDVSIPDQRRQGESYCAARRYELVNVFVERGASAINDRRPEFQRMIEAATTGSPPFDVIVVHSFSRFFRDHFELELYVRKLRKNGVKLVSMTQEIGDDPMHVMMRQVMALFDEYQSKENAKHVIRAFKENARQGFWNGALPPIGYRVVAAERRGIKIKKKLAIDPEHAGTIRLIYRLAAEGDGGSGPMGVKKIASFLNQRGIATRTCGRWGIGQVHRILTRRTYIGEHAFNQRSKSGALKPASEIVHVAVPAIVDRRIFDSVQQLLAQRNVPVKRLATTSHPPLLSGVARCDNCAGALSIRTGKSGRYRYYACSTRARQGSAACEGMALPMSELDDLVVTFVRERLLDGSHVEELLDNLLRRRREKYEGDVLQWERLNVEAKEADLRLARLYDAIENGHIETSDGSLKERVVRLRKLRDDRRCVAERARARLQEDVSQLTPTTEIIKAATNARLRLGFDEVYRRHFLLAFTHHVRVAANQLLFSGSKLGLVATLTAGGNCEVRLRPRRRAFSSDEFIYAISRF